MDSFTTLRSILRNGPIPAKNSDDGKDRKCPPKSANKRKAAFEAWHEKKLAQMGDSSSTDPSTTTTMKDSELKRHLLSPPIMQVSSVSSQLEKSEIGGNYQGPSQSTTTPTAAARNLTTPKLSRHNDAAFYPNIQCILCHEWVCSRNRYMHIESHFQYRPYKCSVCGYDNRKQIFIELHINRVHKGAAQILYQPDSELEKRAWSMAERCLQHTREVLLRRQMNDVQSLEQEKPAEPDSSVTSPRPSSQSDAAPPILASYTGVYRPKIFNNQRSEKSNLIEESRMLGLIPDLSEVTALEERCCLCDSHVLRSPALLEEHARTHLSRASYSCSVNSCTVVHHSKNFISRHMKEVHRIRKGVNDLLDHHRSLFDEYLATCCRCFPQCFAGGLFKDIVAVERPRFRYDDATPTSSQRNGQYEVVDETSSTMNGHCKVENHQEVSARSGECKVTNGEDGVTQNGRRRRSGETARRLGGQCKVNGTSCFGCVQSLSLFAFGADGGTCVCCRSIEEKSTIKFISVCQLCNELLAASNRRDILLLAESHSLTHCSTMPFQCNHCSFSHWRPSDFERHRQENHEDDLLTPIFRWATISTHWLDMWRDTFERCFSINDQDRSRMVDSIRSSINDPENDRCLECQIEVPRSAIDRLQHSLSIHSDFVDCQSQCLYCPVGYSEVGDLSAHMNQVHPDQPMIRAFSIITGSEEDQMQSDVSIRLQDIQDLYGRCFDIGSSLSGGMVTCQLCHSGIPHDPSSLSSHAHYHSATPIYRCRSCAYLDIDVDRMKRHVDDQHQGKVPYYAETLPSDQEARNARLMELCFKF